MVSLQEDWVGKLWGHILGDQHHKRGGGGGQVGVEQGAPSSAALREQALQDSSGERMIIINLF